MQNNNLRLPVFITLVVLLAINLSYSIWRGKSSLLEWPELLIVAMIFLVAVGERFTRFKITPKELTIEQQVEEFKAEARAIQRLADSKDTENIEALLNKATRMPSEVWLKLIFYRLVLRAVLRRKASRSGIHLYFDTSITRMLMELRERGVLADDLVHEIDFLREVTYTAEWGAGRFPSEKDVRVALEKAPDILRRLDSIGSEET